MADGPTARRARPAGIVDGPTARRFGARVAAPVAAGWHGRPTYGAPVWSARVAAPVAARWHGRRTYGAPGLPSSRAPRSKKNPWRLPGDFWVWAQPRTPK